MVIYIFKYYSINNQILQVYPNLCEFIVD